MNSIPSCNSYHFKNITKMNIENIDRLSAGKFYFWCFRINLGAPNWKPIQVSERTLDKYKCAKKSFTEFLPQFNNLTSENVSENKWPAIQKGIFDYGPTWLKVGSVRISLLVKGFYLRVHFAIFWTKPLHLARNHSFALHILWLN